MQCASHDSIGSLSPADSDWLVLVGLDKARISNKISASRSGGSGGMLIYVKDAAELKLCLFLRFFGGQTIPRSRSNAVKRKEWRYLRSTVSSEFSGYSRAREYAESGSAVSRFLITVLR